MLAKVAGRGRRRRGEAEGRRKGMAGCRREEGGRREEARKKPIFRRFCIAKVEDFPIL